MRGNLIILHMYILIKIIHQSLSLGFCFILKQEEPQGH